MAHSAIEKYNLMKQFYGWRYPDQVTDDDLNQVIGEGEWIVIKFNEEPVHKAVQSFHRVRLNEEGVIIFISMKV